MHKHAWRVIEKIEQDSAWDQINSSRVKSFKGGGDSWEELTRRPYIVTYECKECGEQKVTRV